MEIVKIIVGTFGGGGSVQVIDNLTSSSTTAALSANQGRVLNETKVDAAGAAAAAPVQSVNGRGGLVTLTKADVGLGAVDNTSDADKPISTATAAALAEKANTADLAPVATSGQYADLQGTPQIVVAETMPSDISGYPDGTIFIIG
ncbi:hypothetical protein [Chitinophaga japonensis]|uniref:Uncharacterized protein n=1 Tax=Chitinophaga japonensis TaxID=104662 RepID=A0A562SZ00_CHIJA|nr:hypothetical protein [Chitinophaga japonensis]TWI86288.1 hypothetical protein LX66_3542 [Chitinophaga japonensis]